MNQTIMAFLGRLLRNLLAWKKPVPVRVPVRKERPRRQTNQQRMNQSPRSGLTLVEMLVTLAITLIMMGAVVNIFARVGRTVSDRQAAIEMSGQLRTARLTLQRDLAGVTVPLLPWARSSAGGGYFEVIEGPRTDVDSTSLSLKAADSLIPPAADVADPDNLVNIDTSTGLLLLPTGLGDYDDILAMTVRSQGEPFIGRVGGGTAQSNIAEVIWFAVENPTDKNLDIEGEPGMRTIYRRVLLIKPDVSLPSGFGVDDASQLFQRYDISAHYDALQGRWIANTLADLTKRENRFAHIPLNAPADNSTFPYAMDMQNIRIAPGTSTSPLHPFGFPFEHFVDFSGDTNPHAQPGNTNNRVGEDIMLTSVLGFDIRVYDPLAPLRNSGTGVNTSNSAPVMVQPGDPGWSPPTSLSDIIAQGAYVDLGYNAANEPWTGSLANPRPPLDQLSQFSLPMAPKAGLLSNAMVKGIYDTWAFDYEADGIDQDGDGEVDEGTNGIDDQPQQFGVDDMGERETSPPYASPLRGIQIKIRMYEPDSRRVKETSVIQSFIP